MLRPIIFHFNKDINLSYVKYNLIYGKKDAFETYSDYVVEDLTKSSLKRFTKCYNI